jgi:hypothetical protein
MARVGNSVKFLLLIWAISGGAAANPSMSCPALQIVAQCGASGAEISLKPGRDTPAGVSFLITAQGEGQIAEPGAQSLETGGEMRLHPLGTAGSQLTLAVLGLEGAGAATPCCFSNQRVHVPECAAKIVPEDSATDPAKSDVTEITPPKPISDLAVDLTLVDSCQLHEEKAFCEGVLTLTATGAPLGDAVKLTLSSAFAEALRSDGFTCSEPADGQSLCQLPRPATSDSYDLVLKTRAKPPEVQLCATLGIDPDAQGLALQAALRDAGYDVGVFDGQVGAKTLTALQSFLADAGLPSADGILPSEALAALGLADFSDADMTNNRSCAVAKIPAPPLVCDAKTARLDGGSCLCKFKAMKAVSATACACPKGTVLGKKGCVEQITDPVGGGGGTPETPLQCDVSTTVLRNGTCACRYEGMMQDGKTACRCESGLPPLPGLGCDVPILEDKVIDVAPDPIPADPIVSDPAPAAP